MSELLTRGVTNVTPKDLAEKKLKGKEPIRVYLGIDPTGAHLHLGHSVPLRKLQAFADAGHEVIFLIGSFTAMIGDPTGRDQMREPLTRKEVKKNFEEYKKQASKVLDFRKVKIRYNHKWLEKLGFEYIIKLASHFTVQQMLQRDMFYKNLLKVQCPSCTALFKSPIQATPESFETMVLSGNITNCPHCGEVVPLNKKHMQFSRDARPIGLHEFLYPLMVGYDSVYLDVDAELGGNDQEFNMLAGRTLQAALGKKDKFILTTKLIEGTDGRKMSKTYDNCIYLDEKPNDMFGKVMRINDDLIEVYFECCTDVPMDEVKKILKGNPREAKIRLAREIVTLYHDASAAEAGEKHYNEAAAGGVPEDAPTVNVKKGTLLIDALVDNKLVASKSEARRMIEQGGVKKNDTTVSSVEAEAEEGEYKIGKRKFIRISL